MRNFKEFLKLQEAAPKMASPLKGAAPLQTGDINFPMLGGGTNNWTGPSNLGQWHTDYSKQSQSIEWKTLGKASNHFQNIASAINNGDPEFGRNAYVQGTPENNGWIMNVDRDSIVHVGSAHGYQFSPTEIDWLTHNRIIVPTSNPNLVNVNLSITHDLILKKNQEQRLALGATHAFDTVVDRMNKPGSMTREDPLNLR